MTAWRARLAALRAGHAGAEGAGCADSAGPPPGAESIGATGSTGTGTPDGSEARARFLAGAAAEALAALSGREPDPLEGEERAAVAAEAAGAFGTPLAPTEHRQALAGLLRAGLARPPSWSDPEGVPPPGAWCTCCGRHHRRGGRWWREAEAPRGWRCMTCHPAPPGPAVVEVRT